MILPFVQLSNIKKCVNRTMSPGSHHCGFETALFQSHRSVRFLYLRFSLQKVFASRNEMGGKKSAKMYFKVASILNGAVSSNAVRLVMQFGNVKSLCVNED